MVSFRVFNTMNILLIGLFINVSIKGINSMPCDEGWLEYDDTCLKYYNTTLDWSSAEGTCITLRNALIATVYNPEINMFVQNKLTKERDVWIGLRVPSISKSSWKWSDGNNTSSYNDWNHADVTTACAVMKYDNSEGHWYTRPCTETRFYVCEKEMSDDNCTDWLHFDSHCYLIIQKQKDTNMAAAQNCWQNGGYLISINSQREADFIYSNIEINMEYWIGLSPLKWANDVPYQWNNWDDNGPNHNITYGCVYMDATHGKWSSGHCGASVLPATLRPYICQRDAVIDFSITPNVMELDTPTITVYSERNTAEFDALNLSTIPSSGENSKRLLLTVIVPAVCGGLVVIIVIIVVVILARRKKRSNGYNKRNQPPTNTTYVTNDKAVRGGSNEDKREHQGQENYIYDEAEVVQADNGTVLVNGDVYAIVDKDKIQNPKVQDNMVSQQHTKNNRKQEIAKGQNHIIIGSDVYAIVNKNSVKADSQQKPKQKKKKPPTPPKLEDNSGEINSNGLSHVVVGTDVYAVVDKEKVKPNKQQTTQQKKKKPPTPPKLEDKTEDINTNGQSHEAVGTDVYAVVDKEKVKPNKHQKPQQRKKKPPAPPKLVEKADVMHEGSVYNESDINAMPATPTKRKPKGKKETEDTGIVYADLDLTESGSSNRQSGIIYEQSGVVYADLRG